jgi:translocation and assembly module TamB
MRRLCRYLGFGLLAALLALAALPWWLGPVLRAACRQAGVEFAAYETRGYAAFALRDVRLARDGLDLWIGSVEAPTPVVWAWQRLRGGAATVRAGEWELEIARADPTEADASRVAANEDTDAPHGWQPLHARLAGIVATVARWLPAAETGSGRVHVAGVTASLESAVWRDRELRLTNVRARGRAIDAEWSWPEGAPSWRFAARARTFEAAGTLVGSGDLLIGEGEFWGQPARGEAHFAAEGWLPARADFEAAGWRLDGDRLGLGEAYAVLAGELRLRWGDRRLSVVAQAEGEPLAGGDLPPLTVDVRGGGDLGEFSVEALEARMPGLRATLSTPFIFRSGETLAGAPSHFRLECDLAELPWSGWSGRIHGEAVVTPAGARWPGIEGSLEAEQVARGEWSLPQLQLRGRLDWPVLTVAQFTGEMAGGGRLEGEGGWNFAERRLLASRLEAVVPRALVERWLPPAVQFAQARVSARGEGAWPEIRHEGSLEIETADLPPLKPVQAAATWQGEGVRLTAVESVLRREEASLVLRGMLGPEGARIETLDSRAGEETRWSLVEPVAVFWSDGLTVDSLRWRRGDARLDLSLRLGDEGAVRLAAGQIDSDAVAHWVAMPGPAWRVQSLEGDGRWADGPLEFSAAGNVAIALGEGREATIEAAVTGGAEGLRIGSLTAAEGQAAILRAAGSLPFLFRPNGAPRFVIEEKRGLEAEFASEPNPEFWAQVAALTGLQLEAPVVRATLGGTWRNPRGDVAISAERVAVPSGFGGRNVPELRSLAARLSADGEGIELTEFSLLVAEQAVRAQGRLPVAPGRWTELLDDPGKALGAGADLRIEIPDADLAALARFVPEYLAPTGRLRLDLTVRPDGEWNGFLKLENAASRPLGPLGVLQDAGADIRFTGNTVEIREAMARMGGQPVRLTGTARWPEGAQAPALDLALKGENLPFVRQTGLLVRGDLDLRLRTRGDGRTRIEGTTRLRDSLFLADVRALIPRGGRGAAPNRRPPYFAVDVAPLRDWELEVDVQGDRFLRLRTPLFNGTASARFRLGGTLGDPRAIGEATINEGQVRLPFANFAVRQGAVRLTEADPYEPQLAIDGTARRFGYDLRMELGGTASRPNLVFTSSPPLESEEVLLLVMTGEVPGDEFAYTGTQRAVRLGTYLGQSLLGQLGGDPARAERLSLTTGERVSRQGRETYGFSYELDHRWSLVGEYDEFDDYNVGVKRRLFAREPKPEEDPAAKETHDAAP